MRNVHNAQNDQLYFPQSVKKCEVEEQCHHPKKQRPNGQMLHVCLTAARGGRVLAPHFYDPGETVTHATCARMSNITSLPQIRSPVKDKPWASQHDGASAHQCNDTCKFIAEKNIDMIAAKWPAASAFLNPLDYYFNSKLETELYMNPEKGHKVATLGEVKTAVLRIIEGFNADPVVCEEIRKACMQFAARCEECSRRDGSALAMGLRKKKPAAGGAQEGSNEE